MAGEANVDRDAPPVMGSEDFAYMMERVPGAHISIGNGATAGVHNHRYDFNDEAIPYGAALYAAIVERKLPKGTEDSYGSGLTAYRGSDRNVAMGSTHVHRPPPYDGFPITWAVTAGCAASAASARETGRFRAATFCWRASTRAFCTIGVMSLCTARDSRRSSVRNRAP